MPGDALVLSGGSLGLLGTALTLGIRHGIDWDHIAAITDITGTVTNDARRSRPGETGVAPGPGRVTRRAIGLASMYALGHAVSVVVLGTAALTIGQLVPDWVDPIMERVVGVTLLLLGGWILWSLVRNDRSGGAITFRSRWMVVGAVLRRVWNAVARWGHGHDHGGPAHVHRIVSYGPRSAFGVGVIHGIGAETGTQVLLIASIGGADATGLGGAMMMAFVAGLLISNTAIAALSAAGFIATSAARWLMVGTGIVAAVFSLVVGTAFTLGVADILPEILGG
ncbi:MAG: hypothetical protein EBT47_04695 [Chloroflexi bacterium]|nr:hypothetical protein [Chloroflexota bacterium]